MHISQTCSVAIHCLIFISEYGEEHNVTSSLLSKSTGCNVVIIRTILSSLKKAEIISTQSGVGNAKLARAPEDITLLDVFNALEPEGLQKLIGIHASPSEQCPVGRNIYGVLGMSYEHIRNDLKESLKAIHLDTIIQYYHQHLEQEQGGI